MGVKLMWTGLTLIMCGGRWDMDIPSIGIVGAVFMVIGCVLMWLDK